jgi:hypothetical protein
MASAPASTGCRDCDAGLAHCHEPSIEHADGFTECIDPACALDHCLHEWQLPCSVFDPPCACVSEEADLDGTMPLVGAPGGALSPSPSVEVAA